MVLGVKFSVPWSDTHWQPPAAISLEIHPWRRGGTASYLYKTSQNFLEALAAEGGEWQPVMGAARAAAHLTFSQGYY